MATAISNRLPQVVVAYDSPRGRVTKHFENAYTARRFYAKQYGLGTNPSVLRSSTMATATTTKKVVKKTAKTTKTAKAKKAPTKKAKKAPAKKAPTKKAKKAAPTRPDHLRNPQIAILTLLNKSKKGMTRQELAAKVAGSMSEHIGSLREGATPNQYTKSLLEWKYVKPEKDDEDGKDVVRFVITASGRKAYQREST